MKEFFISTLGCKVNQYESEAIALCLQDAGWTHNQPGSCAALCIINTCTVTGKASMQSRQAIRRIIKDNPDAFVLVTGCYAQTEADEIRKIEGVDAVVGHKDKHKIPKAILEEVELYPRFNEDKACKEKIFKKMPVVVTGKRSRPFLKIQDGCDAFCTYCIVPFSRGRSRSMPEEDLLSHLKELSAQGYYEAVLTGIHVGCYGLDLSPKTSLTALFRTIMEKQAVGRLRLSSIEPAEITEEMIDLVAESKTFCDHFHIPLQSGDDTILKRMHRPYDSSLFRDLVKKIHDRIPFAAIGADTLIGFPGESEANFENTYNLIKSLPITYLHVFPFSPRKGTPAFSYPDQVPSSVLKERCERMRILGQEKKLAFYRSMEGRTEEVLIEGKRDKNSGLLKGITSNYVTVLVEGGEHRKNGISRVKIGKLHGKNAVLGTIEESQALT